MSTVEETYVDNSTTTEKLIASFSGFGFACATFIFSTLVLVPTTFYVASWARTPDWLNAMVVFVEMFGLTAVAGIYGVLAAERGFVASRELGEDSA
ncbi:MAG: hypothetical protein AAGD11_06660 [Planctomycetota bacterium]